MQLSALAIFFCLPLSSFAWELGPFERADHANPILSPCKESLFDCPLAKSPVNWEGDHTFNPAAVVRYGNVYLIYRAEDDSGTGIGKHTSRLGIAVSTDGLHFMRAGIPILYPQKDDQQSSEWPGGCEDPRIVESEDGTYIMTYTQWNRKMAVLAVAISRNLLHWKKHGYVFEQGPFSRRWSKSGSIVCRLEGDRLIATRLQGKYWMYWGEGCIYAATSEDLIHWEAVLDEEGNPLPVLTPRPWNFDSALVEPGPPAILTDKGIVFLYNGKNAVKNGDPGIAPGPYAAGQLLLDANDPTKWIQRTPHCFFKPERDYERKGQYQDGTVFIQGLVHFQGKWFLYYGAADSVIGVAVSKGCGSVSRRSD